jgi:phosphoglycerol transferase MdoB-like AlkP superfamily enzyme
MRTNHAVGAANSTSLQSSLRWERTIQQIQQDLLLWLLLVLIMQIQRLALLLVFNAQWSPESGVLQYFSVAWLGFRYDMSIAMYLVLPCIIASAVCLFGNARRFSTIVRAVWSPVVVIVVMLIGIINTVFFAEFHEQFNHFALGAMQGYLGPVIETAWSEYPLGWLSLAFLVAVVVVVWGLRRLLSVNWLCRPWPLRVSSHPLVRVTIMALCVVGIVFAVRGGFGRRPIQFKDSAATSDTELNKVVPNALSSLRYAVQQHLRLMSASGLQAHLQGEQIAQAAAGWSGLVAPSSVDDVTRRVASGSKIARPQHVFLIIMESADSWAMKPDFRSLHLSDQLVDIASRGISADFFVSAGPGSIASVASIVTGLPEVGVTTNYQPNSTSLYKTSLAAQMKAIGYQPRFFKGSFLVFQRYGEFAQQQGFEVVEGAEAIRREGIVTNEWGVQDDALFDHVIASLDGAQPTFNVVVSTTYHPPYDLDVYALGYPVTTAPTDLSVPCEMCSDRWLQTVGHAWFADKSLGNFVRSVEQDYPDALFVITGDHWSRRYVTARPPLPLIRETPLVMYGPGVLGELDTESFFGSHTDIAPTLIELIADSGHEYWTFGRDMLSHDQQHLFSAGSGLVMGDGFVIDTGTDRVIEFDELSTDVTVIQSAKRWNARTNGLAWWRIMEGSALPLAEAGSSAAP